MTLSFLNQPNARNPEFQLASVLRRFTPNPFRVEIRAMKIGIQSADVLRGALDSLKLD